MAGRGERRRRRRRRKIQVISRGTGEAGRHQGELTQRDRPAHQHQEPPQVSPQLPSSSELSPRVLLARTGSCRPCLERREAGREETEPNKTAPQRRRRACGLRLASPQPLQEQRGCGQRAARFRLDEWRNRCSGDWMNHIFHVQL